MRHVPTRRAHRTRRKRADFFLTLYDGLCRPVVFTAAIMRSVAALRVGHDESFRVRRSYRLDRPPLPSGGAFLRPSSSTATICLCVFGRPCRMRSKKHIIVICSFPAAGASTPQPHRIAATAGEHFASVSRSELDAVFAPDRQRSARRLHPRRPSSYRRRCRFGRPCASSTPTCGCGYTSVQSTRGRQPLSPASVSRRPPTAHATAYLRHSRLQAAKRCPRPIVNTPRTCDDVFSTLRDLYADDIGARNKRT